MVTFKGKVVVITGASSGIGKATALEFAKRGASVVLAARRVDRLHDLQKYISKFNKNCVCVKTDVTSEKDVKRLFETAENRFHRVDILVNNAGRGLKSGVCDISLDDWLSVINTNLTGVFLCTKEALKQMIRKKIKGHLITVSSVAGLYGAPNYSAYCASKHGVTGFQRSIKWEMRKYGIRTSTIFPARVDTEFFNSYKRKPGRSQMLSPYDIADYILAIASGSLLRRAAVRSILIFKRIYYFIRYIGR
ncbi:MAG: SDR family oxidoreductase [Candidatus Woesearchaeota archaeon]